MSISLLVVGARADVAVAAVVTPVRDGDFAAPHHAWEQLREGPDLKTRYETVLRLFLREPRNPKAMK